MALSNLSIEPYCMEFFHCVKCLHVFEYEDPLYHPISLPICCCTICRQCFDTIRNEKNCPSDEVSNEIKYIPGDQIVTNYSLLIILSDPSKLPKANETCYGQYPFYMKLDNETKSYFDYTEKLIRNISLIIKPIINDKECQLIFNRPIIQQIFGLLNTQYINHEGRLKVLQAIRSLAERICMYFIVQHTTSHDEYLDSNEKYTVHGFQTIQEFSKIIHHINGSYEYINKIKEDLNNLIQIDLTNDEEISRWKTLNSSLESIEIIINWFVIVNKRKIENKMYDLQVPPHLENLNNGPDTGTIRLQSSTGEIVVNSENNSNYLMDNLHKLLDYMKIMDGTLLSFIILSRKIGRELFPMMDHIMRLFDAQKQFIRQATYNKKPTNDQQITELIEIQSNEIEAISAYRSKNRKSPLFNHLSTISEGILAFDCIFVSPTQISYTQNMIDASQFYAKRILQDYGAKYPIHAEWVKQWMTILNEYHNYVKQHHIFFFAWTSKIQRDYGVRNSGNCMAASRAPSLPLFLPTSLFSNMQIDDDLPRNDLMNSINASVTNAASHLVSNELEVHKNLHLEEQTIERLNKSQSVTSNTSSNITSGPVKLELQGNTWIVEYYSGRSDLKITETNMTHKIYVSKCSNSTLTVEDRVNSIILDQCINVVIQFISPQSLVQFVNCREIKAEVLGYVSTIQIENTDDCHIYLSYLSLDTEFITSKSSRITIHVPFGDGRYKEYPIPEQFKTCLQYRGRLITVPNKSSGV